MGKVAASLLLVLGLSTALWADPCSNGNANGNPHCVAMPEPSQLSEAVIGLLGLAGLAVWRRRSKPQA